MDEQDSQSYGFRRVVLRQVQMRVTISRPTHHYLSLLIQVDSHAKLLRAGYIRQVSHC